MDEKNDNIHTYIHTYIHPIIIIHTYNNVEVVDFADDIAVVVTAKFTEEVTRIGNEAIETIWTWLDTVGLSLQNIKRKLYWCLAGK